MAGLGKSQALLQLLMTSFSAFHWKSRLHVLVRLRVYSAPTGSAFLPLAPHLSLLPQAPRFVSGDPAEVSSIKLQSSFPSSLLKSVKSFAYSQWPPWASVPTTLKREVLNNRDSECSPSFRFDVTSLEMIATWLPCWKQHPVIPHSFTLGTGPCCITPSRYHI